jgi:hypothetical protein
VKLSVDGSVDLWAVKWAKQLVELWDGEWVGYLVERKDN